MNRPPRAALTGLFAALALGAAALAPATARGQGMVSDRQVTVFGVLATQGQGEDDPKLKEILPQLRAAMPGHRFKLLKVASKRVAAGQAVECDLGDGSVAATQLMTPLDANGKVQLRFQFSDNGVPAYQSVVSTPPNQVFYVNRVVGPGERLIVGIGAR